MGRISLMRQFWTVGFVATLVIGARSQALGAILTSISNGGFEEGTGGLFSGVPAGSVPSATNPGWNGSGGYANGAGVWFSPGGPGTLHDNSFAPVFPTFTGVRAGSLIAHSPPPQMPAANNQAILYQSLGTVDASDVGKTFLLSADMGSRAFPNRAYQGDMTVRFGTGAAAANPIGTPGVIHVDANPDLLPLPPAFGLNPATALFSPSAADVGTEIFAAVHLLNFTPYGGDENQYVVDNVRLSVVPEPSMIVLVCAAFFGASYMTRRKR